MEYQEIKKMEMERAESFINEIHGSKDPYFKYKQSRPITDLKHMFETSVELYGDHTAFMQKFKKGEEYTRISYAEALEDINGLGTSLIKQGLKGKRIALIGENCYQWASSYLAVTCGTGIIVPLDRELGKEELTHLIKESESSAVLFTKKYESIFREMKESGETGLEVLVNLNAEEESDGVLSWKQLISEGMNMVASGDRSFLDAEIVADDMGVLLFTSGTTGLAKAVMLSHTNICTDLMSAPLLLETLDTDTFFSVLPLHHTYECTCGFLMPMYKGSCVAYCEGLKYIQKNLKEVNPTFFLAVPLIFESLYKTIMKNIKKKGLEDKVAKIMKWSRVTSKFGINLNRILLKDIIAIFGENLDVMIAGGAAIDPEILTFFNELGFVAVQGYGLTECAPMAALSPDIHKLMRPDSVGHLLPGMEVKIIDKAEDGTGEICLKGNNVMLGYYNRPDETADALQDGWFHTGDLGYVDDEDFIYITGRKKNVIITANGKNVFPEELEYYLGRVPYVNESMVWAAAAEDGQDTSIVATIRPDSEEIKKVLGDASKDPEAIEKLLWEEIDKINADLPMYKRIKRVSVRFEEFEKTTGHKIKRFVESNRQ